jgi:predicted MFS family arabinose efflux permease
MRIPAIVYVLALGAFALITTELGVIGILPQVSDASASRSIAPDGF